MASLWKHPESKYWVACFTDHTGKQRKKSTKETNKKEAMKRAELLESVYRKHKSSEQMQKLLIEAHREITGEALEQVSTQDFQKRWIESKTAEGCSEATLKFYRGMTKDFLVFLGPVAAEPIGSVTRLHVENFRNSIAAVRDPKTVSHKVKGIRMLFKAAIEAGLMADNPAQFVNLSKKKRGTAKKKKEAFTLAQIRKILPHCTEEWKSMVQLGLYTGQRLGDLQFLKWGQIAQDNSLISLTTRKTGKVMTLPVAAPLKEFLAPLERPKDAEAYVHPELAKLRSNTVSGAFLDILIKAGIRKKGDTAEKRDHSLLSFHSLRHTAVSALKEAGVPLAVVMALIGHDSEEVSEGYTTIGAEAMAAGAAKMPTL